MSEPREIQSYDARTHWGRVLDEVSAGGSYVISKRQRPVAALVPLAEWHGASGSEDGAQARELEALVAELRQRNRDTEAALDRAFEALAATRREIAEARAEREREAAADEGGHGAQ